MQTKKPAFWLVFWDLFLIQLANWRWAWAATLINGLLVPFTIFFFISTIGSTETTAAKIYLLSGNVIASLIFTTMYGTSARFSFMRTFGVLDYYATLPVPKPLLVLAVSSGFFVLTLPSAVITVIIGQIFFGLNLSLSPVFFLLIPLASFSLSAVGAFVGVAAPNFDTANTITGVLQFLFLGLGDILLPADRLPDIADFVSYLLPCRYAAAALRQSLSGDYALSFWLNVGVLCLFNLAAFLFVAYKMEWRRG
jgi:ABC-2 type transport system permease protein